MPATGAHGDVPQRVLGRTGERISPFGLGGWHIGFESIDEALSIRIVRTAIDRGITFMDIRASPPHSRWSSPASRAWRTSSRALEAARTFRPMAQPEVDALLARTAAPAARGEFEPFKTTSIFDATVTHPEWLGEDSRSASSGRCRRSARRAGDAGHRRPRS